MNAKKDTFYITTTLPYVNADPHIGFALEIVQADIIARYKRLAGNEVFFNSGTDEHGIKIYRKALEESKSPQEYVDSYAEKFKALQKPLGLSEDIHFIRTTDERHKRAAQEIWRRCAAAGDIYKKNYKIKYCVGCELEKTDSELVEGKCPIHPNLELEIIEEENYFFRLSKYQDALLELFEREDFLIPRYRLNEMISLINEKGLEDFSISRKKEKMPWGVSVPDDPDQVFYVWFDALVSYISTLGWPDDEANFKKWWIDTGGVTQFAGKDQVRQQAVMWQAMLISAGLPNSKQIIIHGFITSGGQKMSKSLGNVIDPLSLVEEYGTDALRLFLARHIHPFEDSDFTLAKFKESYNADLANGLGNLTSRILKMSETHVHDTNTRIGTNDTNEYPRMEAGGVISSQVSVAFDSYNIQEAVALIWKRISALDQKIQETQPFKLVKTDKGSAVKIIQELVEELWDVSNELEPILPQTAEKIKELIKTNKAPTSSLFPRKD